MKNYSITVNGNVYDVTVEEKGASTPMAPVAAPVAAAPTPAAAPAPAAASGSGSIKINAGAAGKVVSIDSKVGDVKKKGDTVLVLEVMKMETPVVAPSDGTVASIDTAVGNQVQAGELLATLN